MAIKVEVFSTNSCPHCPAAIDAAQVAKDKLGDAIDVEVFKIDESMENRQKVDGEVTFVGAPMADELIQELESKL